VQVLGQDLTLAAAQQRHLEVIDAQIFEAMLDDGANVGVQVRGHAQATRALQLAQANMQAIDGADHRIVAHIQVFLWHREQAVEIAIFLLEQDMPRGKSYQVGAENDIFGMEALQDLLPEQARVFLVALVVIGGFATCLEVVAQVEMAAIFVEAISLHVHGVAKKIHGRTKGKDHLGATFEKFPSKADVFAQASEVVL
jgi:hypothetical protein